MHTVELLEEALAIAEFLGYAVRYEWLGGSSGGACEFGGKKWLFVDLAFSAIEQLEQVAEALRNDPALHTIQLSPWISNLLDIRDAA